MHGSFLDWKQYTPSEIPSSLTPEAFFHENVRPGQAVVDIGCGEGRICFDLLARGLGPVTGIDINENGIRYARRKREQLSEEMQSRCSFEVRSALDTGFPNHSFSAGIMQAVLTTLTTPEHRRAVLREARRILSPNGGLYIADFLQTWHLDTYRQRYEEGEREIGETGSFFSRRKQTGEIEYIAHHYTERELVELLLEAGFRIQHWQTPTLPTRNGNRINGVLVWAV